MHLGAFTSSSYMTFRWGWLQYAGLYFGSETGTLHSTGPFILLLWTWRGQRAPTQRGKMLLRGSWCFFEEWNYTKRKKKGDLPWGRGNVEVCKGWSWCLEVEKEICSRSSSVWVWDLCFAFLALWRGILFNSNYFTTQNLCLRIFCTSNWENKNLSAPSNLLRLVLKVAFLRNP